MTTRQSTTANEGSLGRDTLSAVRSYLANRWTLLALGSGLAVGLGFGSKADVAISVRHVWF